MSPLNVHVTRYPASGEIVYSKYHPGKYLVAWHPKSSDLNERTTIVINNPLFWVCPVSPNRWRSGSTHRKLCAKRRYCCSRS